MAVPATRTWIISANNTYSANLMDDQFQEGVYAFKAILVLAGWTVIRSSDGIVADDTDNWGSSADIGFGTTGNGAWIVLRSPAGWLTNSETVEMLFYVNDTAGTPQIAEIRFCVTGYRDGDANGNGTNSLPVANGFQTTVNTSGRSIVPWASDGIVGRYTTWYTTRGDVMICVKEEGATITTSEINHCWSIFSNTDALGGGEGDQRWLFFGRSSTASIFLNGQHLTGTHWRGFMPSGDQAPASIEGVPIIHSVANWDFNGLGQSVFGEYVAARIPMWSDDGGNRRYYGLWPDVFQAIGGSGNFNRGWNEDDTSEAAQDPQRILSGDVWLYLPNGVTWS